LGNEWLDAAFDEVAVVRSDASRFYVVTSTRRDRAVAVAEALP
jgi:hypothetical protein